MELFRSIKWSFHFIERFFLFLSCLGCAAMVAALFAASLARWLSIPVFFLEDFATFTMSSCVFLALAAVTYAREHISAQFFIDQMTPGMQAWQKLLSDGLFLVYALILTWFCFRLFYSSYESGLQSNGLIAVPLALPQAVMCIGMVALVLRSGVNFVTSTRGIAGPVPEAN